MEWTDPWFISYIHDDTRDKDYMTTWSKPTFMLCDLIADNLLCYIENCKAQQLRLDRPSSSTKRHLENTQG